MAELLTDAPLAETSQRSAVIDVADQIVASIRDGQLVPGQRLVETDFAKRLGVARTTIREAFQRLEVEGVLSQERHRGFLVRMLTRARLRDVFQLRESLEGLAARLAAPKFRRDHQKLKAYFDALEQARSMRNMREFTLHNRLFHDLIRLESGNPLLCTTLQSLEKSVYYFQFRLLVESERVFDSQDEHRAIFEALRAGKAEVAEEASRQHVRHTRDALLQLPDHLFAID